MSSRRSNRSLTPTDGVQKARSVAANGCTIRPRIEDDATCIHPPHPHGRGIATADIPIAPLGSGSDYSALLEHLGIATLDRGLGGEASQGGVYHSRYDDFEHFDRFGDPGFKYEVALAVAAGHIVLRTADAEVLPMRVADFSATLDRHVRQLHDEADRERSAADTQQKLLDANAFKLAADPLHPVALRGASRPAPTRTQPRTTHALRRASARRRDSRGSTS